MNFIYFYNIIYHSNKKAIKANPTNLKISPLFLLNFSTHSYILMKTASASAEHFSAAYSE